MSSYVAVASGPQAVGDQFRITMTMRSPYSIENVVNIEDTWRAKAGVSGHVTTDRFVVTYPRADGTWTATAYYTVQQNGVTGDTVANFARNVVSWVMDTGALVGVKLEQLVIAVADTAGKSANALTKPLLDNLLSSPGLLLLGGLAIFLYLKR